MADKRNKYDTDPLDPDFARRTEEIMGRTENVARTPEAHTQREPLQEDPTRRLPEQYPSSYPSVFVPPTYQPPPPQPGYTTYGSTTPPQQQSAMPPMQTPYAPPAMPPVAPGPASPYSAPPQSRSHQVAKLGIPEHIANVLPYAPFYIGLVFSLVELVVVPRHEARTRFHAAQGLALHLAIIALTFLFSFIGAVTGSRAGGRMLGLAAFIFLIFSMWRVWQGRPHHLAPLDDATKFLDQRIDPRK